MGIGKKFLHFSRAQMLKPKNVSAVTNDPILCSGYDSILTLVCTPKKHSSSSDVFTWGDNFTWGDYDFAPSRIQKYIVIVPSIRGVDQLLQFIFIR